MNIRKNRWLKTISLIIIALVIFSPLLNTPRIAYADSLEIGDVVEIVGFESRFGEVFDTPGGNFTSWFVKGSRGVILDGPVAGDNCTWWNIRFEKDGLLHGQCLEGWMKDRGISVPSYLPPYPPLKTIDYLGKVDIAPSSRFSLGSSVIVAASNLSIGGSFPVLSSAGEVHNAAKGQVIGGPVYGISPGGTGFHHFWAVAFDDVTGWVAENWLIADDNQTLDCLIYPAPSSGELPRSFTSQSDGTLVNTGLVVEFSLGAVDTTGNISSWELDVGGDGIADYQGTGFPPATVSHRYREAGTYGTVLTVTSSSGSTAGSYAPVSIISTMPTPPVCGIFLDTPPEEYSLEVSFSLDVSDAGSGIVSWELDADSDGNIEYSGTGMPPDTQLHSYIEGGSYIATFTVTDNEGLIASSTVDVIVEVPSNPELSFSPAYLAFDTLEGGDNPENQALSIWNSGTGTLEWIAEEDAGWLNLNPVSGTSNGETENIMVSVITTGLSAGLYNASIYVIDKDAGGIRHNIPVTLLLSEPDVEPSPELEADNDTETDIPPQGIVSVIPKTGDSHEGSEIPVNAAEEKPPVWVWVTVGGIVIALGLIFWFGLRPV